MGSFDSVNYSLRPNKAVERKVVFAGLQKLRSIVDLSGHRYVGLGSLWFVDYLMAHKLLGVSRMTSIERTTIGAKRADFNRPLKCIEVIQGDSTQVLPELGLETGPSIVWMDYDSSIDGPVLEDISLLAPHCTADSILIVTINAKKDQLETKDEQGQPMSDESSLRRIARDLVPTPLDRRRLQPSRYPMLLGEILTNQFLTRTVNSGRAEAFIKLFELSYSDGTPMITVGGILASGERGDRIRAIASSEQWEGIASEMISIPPLTAREKIALDRMLPSVPEPTIGDVNEAGFALLADQLRAYNRYYRHYPVFGELLGY